jgi:hypothetical protein
MAFVWKSGERAFESGAEALAKPVSNRHRNERNCKSGNAARCHASSGRADETGGYDGKVGSLGLMTMRRSSEQPQ